MANNKSKSIIFIVALVVVALGYFILTKDKFDNKQTAVIAPVFTADSVVENSLKTFKFDNFHGSTDISDKFQFQYPASWYNDGQYFSPEKIQFFTKYEAKAPIWFDLVLAEIFDYTELKYQIDESKRKSSDAVGKIDGREFKKYDLIDYGTYGGESAGRVKIFVGPKIKIDGLDYILVFHWEERPLAEYMAGNNIEVFDNMLLSLKFLQ